MAAVDDWNLRRRRLAGRGIIDAKDSRAMSRDEDDNVNNFSHGSSTTKIQVFDFSLANFAALQSQASGCDSDPNDNSTLIDFESGDTMTIVCTLCSNLIAANCPLYGRPSYDVQRGLRLPQQRFAPALRAKLIHTSYYGKSGSFSGQHSAVLTRRYLLVDGYGKNFHSVG